MPLLLKFTKRQVVPTAFVSILYVFVLLLLILKMNSNSMIYYKISPYTYASEILDFFFSLIVSIPFSYYTFFMKKTNFLEYVSLRISKKTYIKTYFGAIMVMCFSMIFLVNFVGVLFSYSIAQVTSSEIRPTLEGYILGQMQMDNPILFGIVWSLHKAFVGTMICLFAQIIALYVENFFLALCVPFVYVILENFFTSILGLSRYSLTTTFVLNRLKPTAMSVGNLIIAISVFFVIINIARIVLRGYYEK